MPDLKLDMMTHKSRRAPAIELQVRAMVRFKGSQNQTRSAAGFIDRCAPVIDLMRKANFGPCGVGVIEMTSATGENLAILSQVGEPAKPDEMHKPVLCLFRPGRLHVRVVSTGSPKACQGRDGQYVVSDGRGRTRRKPVGESGCCIVDGHFA